MSRYLAPASLGEALAVLAEGQARVVAGGTDLMIALRRARLRGQPAPDTLLDVTRVPELTRLDLDAPRPWLGAGLTFRELEIHPEVARVYPLLARAAASVGSAQVRATATIGGNAANGSPAADGVAALTALGAVAEIASPEGARLCPLPELITGVNQTTLGPRDIILGFSLDPPTPAAGQAFAKVGRRQAVAVARLNLAVCLDRALIDPRVVLGACFPSPRRLADVEELLARGKPGPELWRAAGQKAADHFVAVCGWRSSAPYKVPAVTRMLAQTLAECWAGLEG